MSKHEKFILTPITSVIEEMKMASSGVQAGIDVFALGEYVLQATFTKMTGFQEQKMQCIDWELATNGFDYRRSYLEEIKEKGTYSTYDSKKKVYNALLNEISRYSGKDKATIISEVSTRRKIEPRKCIQDLFDETNIVYCMQREYETFKKCDSKFQNQYLTAPQSNNALLFESSLKARYENELYRNRNRIAHNTLSYQQNLPDLKTLQNEDGLSRNYFFWFSILYLIDEIFMELYRMYLVCLENNSYFDD